jgi:hypothetical protein
VAARIGGAQIDPEGLATLSRQFKRVERRAGRWLQHIGLVGLDPRAGSVSLPVSRRLIASRF